MLTELVDRLDDCLSPADGIVAIDQIFIDLPILHRGQAIHRHRAKPRKIFKVYRARFGWFDLGFNYLQLGKELHIVELWRVA